MIHFIYIKLKKHFQPLRQIQQEPYFNQRCPCYDSITRGVQTVYSISAEMPYRNNDFSVLGSKDSLPTYDEYIKRASEVRF